VTHAARKRAGNPFSLIELSEPIVRFVNRALKALRFAPPALARD
jgi:hypothetical protein